MDLTPKFSAASLLGGVALSCMLTQAAMADTITLSVYAALAPNHHGSPSYAAWAANAIQAIQLGDSSYGTPGSPTYYQQVGSLTDSNNIVTSFNSWNGVANPGGSLAGELGNRLTYIAVATDTTGANINLGELRESLISTDPGNVFGLTYNWSTSTLSFGGGSGPPYANNAVTTPDSSTPLNYSLTQVGINGATTITSGLSTQAANELIVVGWGNALGNSGATCSALGATQAAISCVRSQYDALVPFNMIGSFSLVDGSNTVLATGSDNVPMPEPATMALFGSAVVGLGLVKKRRKKV